MKHSDSHSISAKLINSIENKHYDQFDKLLTSRLQQSLKNTILNTTEINKYDFFHFRNLFNLYSLQNNTDKLSKIYSFHTPTGNNLQPQKNLTLSYLKLQAMKMMNCLIMMKLMKMITVMIHISSNFRLKHHKSLLTHRSINSIYRNSIITFYPKQTLLHYNVVIHFVKIFV